MQRPIDRAGVAKQMKGVADSLAATNLTTEKRMALLRRQAQLCDIREALAMQARRDSTYRTLHHS